MERDIPDPQGLQENLAHLVSRENEVLQELPVFVTHLPATWVTVANKVASLKGLIFSKSTLRITFQGTS